MAAAQKRPTVRGKGSARRRARNIVASFDTVAVGEEIERQWRGIKWWRVKVVKKRKLGEKPVELRVHFLGTTSKCQDHWVSSTDPGLRWGASAAKTTERYLSSWSSDAGHLEDDLWEVESIEDARGEDDSREYKVRWKSDRWDGEDWWLKRDAFPGSELIDSYEAALAEAAAQAEAAKRNERAEYGAAAIDLARGKLLDKLRTQKASAPRRKLFYIEGFAEWQFKALYENLISCIPEGADVGEHLTEIEPIPVNPKIFAADFHVRSHYLAGSFLDCEIEEPERRQHVRFLNAGPGSAVGLLTPLTFKLRGPRDTPRKMKLCVTAAFQSLVGRNASRDAVARQPDWHEADNVSRGALARRLIAIGQRENSSVPAAMIVECGLYA